MTATYTDKYTSTASAAGTTCTIGIPGLTGTGMLMVAYVVAGVSGGSAPGSFTWPSGWTAQDAYSQTDATDGASMRLEIRYRWYQSGDTGQALTFASSSVWDVAVEAWSGVDSKAAAPFEVTGITGSNPASSNAETTPSVSSSVATNVRVSCFSGINSTGTTVTWGSYSPADTKRIDLDSNTGSSGIGKASMAIADSAGPVSSGSTSVTATPSLTIYPSVRWIGILRSAPNNSVPVNISQAVKRAAHY